MLENNENNPQESWNPGVPRGVLNNQGLIVKTNKQTNENPVGWTTNKHHHRIEFSFIKVERQLCGWSRSVCTWPQSRSAFVWTTER